MELIVFVALPLAVLLVLWLGPIYHVPLVCGMSRGVVERMVKDTVIFAIFGGVMSLIGDVWSALGVGFSAVIGLELGTFLFSFSHSDRKKGR